MIKIKDSNDRSHLINENHIVQIKGEKAELSCIILTTGESIYTNISLSEIEQMLKSN